MTAHTCVECHHPIPAGLAVLRSPSLRGVRAWHRECYALQLIPAQRVAESERGAR